MKQNTYVKYWDVIVAVFVASILAVVLLGGRAFYLIPFLCVAYLIPYGIFVHSQYCSFIGRMSLSIAFVSMSVFMLLNYWQSTVLLGTVEEPFLLHDALSFYILSHDIHQGTLNENSPIVPYMAYPIFLSWWIDIGVIDIAYPIILNIGLMLISISLVGRCVYFVIVDRAVAQRVSGYAMLLVSVIPGVLGMATLLAKEPFVILAMMLCVCALYAIKQRYKTYKYWLLFVVGLVLLATFRVTYIYIIALFAIVILGYKLKRCDVLPIVAVVVAMALMICVGVHLSWWGDGSYIEGYISDKNNHNSFFCGESQLPLQQLVGSYNDHPLWLKLCLLPMSVAIQFMIPFPFMTAAPDYGLPISMTVYHRMSYLWYLAAIPMLMYYLFYWWRKGGITKLNLLATVAAVSYCVPAFITAGSVSRYAYCFVPFIAVMGGYVLYRIAGEKQELKRMAVFAVVYIVLILSALFVGANPHLIVK